MVEGEISRSTRYMIRSETKLEYVSNPRVAVRHLPRKE
jgi:hypothetical protein